MSAVRTNHLLRRDAPLAAADLENYFAEYKFSALKRALTTLSAEEVIGQVSISGLRGRGGAAFPTGMKWRAVREQAEIERYVVANGEEGEPGTFKDKVLLERDPLLLLEAMVICAYTVGSNHGYIYLNHNYHTIEDNLGRLIALMHDRNLLGKNIAGSGNGFEIEVRRGRQRYVSGEETALIQAIEGKRVEPTGRPPFPTEKGLWGKPTVINNVESFCCIPLIINHGGEWFAGIGPEGSHGPKLFSVTGNVVNPGIYESSMDLTLRELLAWAGGMAGGEFKCALVSGPSGTLYLNENLNSPLTMANGIGNGTVIVYNDGRCAVDLGRSLTDFFYEEHCGQCLPGRLAMKMVKGIMDDIDTTADLEETAARYESLHQMLAATGKCGLCSSGTGITSRLMQVFAEDFRAHQRGDCRQCGVRP